MRNYPRRDSLMSAALWWSMLSLTTGLLAFFLMNHAQAADVGDWQTVTGEWVRMPCPSAEDQVDETSVVRLPVGCQVKFPRVGYTVVQDLKLRDEVSGLRVSDAELRLELARGRAAADAIIEKLTKTAKSRQDELEAEQNAHTTTTLELELTRKERDEARSATIKYATGVGVVALVIGLLVGVAVVN